MIFKNNSVYDALKIVQIIVPAIGTFYFALANIWQLPYGEQVTATCAALVTLLSVFLKVSSYRYNNSVTETADDDVETANDLVDESEVG